MPERTPIYHRIREVCQQEEMSTRQLAKHLRCSRDQVRLQQDPATNLTLAQLHAWQRVLGVPIADLLVEPPTNRMVPIVQHRVLLLRLAKTAASLRNWTPANSRSGRLLENLTNDLQRLMPELADSSEWDTGGARMDNPDKRFVTYYRKKPCKRS